MIRKVVKIMYFEKIINDYAINGHKFNPATKEQINKLYELWGKLPVSYMEFLQTMGCGGEFGIGDGFMVGDFSLYG